MGKEESWFRKHVDTVVVLSGIVVSILWMNHKFTEADHRFAQIEKDIAIIKAILIT